MRARLISIAIHVFVIAAVLLLPFGSVPKIEKGAEPPLPPIRLHLAPRPAPESKPSGGGERSPTPATKGELPQYAKRPFLPPVLRTEETHPLMMEPSIDVEMPQATLALVQFGDPNARSGPASLGPGLNGIGGSGRDGIGNDSGPGLSSSKALAGGSLTGPVPIYNPDPEFSEEARKAKLQGQVVLEVLVDTDGKAHRIHVRAGLGLGLDEKAIEAVQTWRFRPGRRNGTPIAVPATIYINFRLL